MGSEKHVPAGFANRDTDQHFLGTCRVGSRGVYTETGRVQRVNLWLGLLRRLLGVAFRLIGIVSHERNP
jgi:hypothetical protein